MEKKTTNMKKAAIENILVWIVLFAMFASIFFFVINYTVIIRAKDTMDAIADFGSNYVAVNGIGDDLSNRMNDIKSRNFSNINADTSTICNTNNDNEYKVIFNVTATNNNLYFYNGQLFSKRVVFNQDGTGDTITCDLSVTINN